jgi:hypothetical protein
MLHDQGRQIERIGRREFGQCVRNRLGATVGPREHLRDLLRGLISQLTSYDDELAGVEIARLRDLPALRAWFGFRPAADPQDIVPVNAAEMQERLIALVPPIDRVRLQVWVLDLSMDSMRKAVRPRRPRSSPQKRRTRVAAA